MITFHAGAMISNSRNARQFVGQLLNSLPARRNFIKITLSRDINRDELFNNIAVADNRYRFKDID